MKSTVEIMKAFLEGKSAEDSGAMGKAYEVAIRSYIMRREQAKVKSQNTTDIRFTYEGKRYTCEIKTACGEIEMAEKSQYVIYCPVVDIDFPAEFQGYVFSRAEWKAFVEGYDGRGSFVRVDKKRGHSHIQSFYVSEEVRPKASKPIANYIWRVCDEMPTVEDFFQR